MSAGLLLASTSPRRADLLRAAGVDFTAIDPGEEEEAAHPEGPSALVLANAHRKALAVARRHPGRVVLGADTVVVLQREILGKPRDMDEARSMLGRLSGRIHEVLTGVCLCQAPAGLAPLFCQFVTTSRVEFRHLDGETIHRYLESIHPLDKAGAYAAQSDGGRCIARVEGSLDNVIGLPVREVLAALALHFPEL